MKVIVVDDKFDADVAGDSREDWQERDRQAGQVRAQHAPAWRSHRRESGKLLPMAEIIIHENARANMVAGKMPGLPQRDL